jgi:hypothetical protein
MEPACRVGLLPDDSTGQVLSTRQQAGQKCVTVRGGYGAFFAPAFVQKM